MENEQAQFELLVQNLMSPDNKIRTEAEESYDGVHLAAKIPFLIRIMTSDTSSDEVRSMSAVLLRRLYTSNFEEFWPQLPLEAQNQLKFQMISSIQRETSPAIRKKICECVSEFARNLLDEDGSNQWPEFVKFLFECSLSSNIEMKENALNIFSIVPGIFGKDQNQYLEVIKQMFNQCITYQANQKVRMLAARAAVAFILTNNTDSQVLNQLKDLLPSIIQCVAESISTEDDSLIKSLIDLAEDVPKFLRPQLESIFTLCLKIVSDTNVEDMWRQLALEVIVTLSETAAAMVRKHPKLVDTLVPQVLQLMSDLEDDDEWSFADEVENNDSDSNPVAAESALDRLACSLGGKIMLPHIINNVPSMLQNSDWKYRHAGLMAISACGEGCHAQMEEVLPNIVQAILPFLQDSHPRVRYAACNAIGQMSTDFGPLFQKKFHQEIVPGLLMVMESNYEQPRVQSHAGAALINFSESCPKNILANYLEAIMTRLEQILSAKFNELVEKGTKLVLEQIVSTLASVADAAEEKFEQYYDKFMPRLKYIFQNANAKELKLLRGKTIECISLIGLAVGREKFMQDCSEVMELLLKSQAEWNDMADDDPQISYMISAWARICKIMGKEFEPYLPLVMGPVLKAASIKPEVAVLDGDDMKALESDTDWQFVTLGDQQNFGIRTAGLEEKATACQMLVCYARALKEGFVNYAEEVVRIMVSHLKFYFHDGVRLAAAESLPLLLECAQIKGQEYLLPMWQFICPELLSAIDADPEKAIMAEQMSSLGQCIELMGAGCLTEDQLKELTRILDKIMVEHFERQATKLQQQQADEDYDEEAALEEDEEYVMVLSRVSDVMHAMLGTYKEACLPMFDQLLVHFVKLLAPERSWSDRQWGICIFDDILEYTGMRSQAYSQYFLQPLIQSLTDKRPEIRQASSYGIGVMAKYGGPAYSTTCAEALPILTRVIQDQNSRKPENSCATENAISAVGKICRYNMSNINLPEVLSLWMNWLPVWEDEEECLHVYDYLCDLVEGNNPVILGENNQNLPHLLKLFVHSFHLNAIPPTSEVGCRIINIVRQLQGNEQIFQACYAHLAPEFQKTLMSVLS